MNKTASATLAIAGLTLSLGLASCGGDYDNALFNIVKDAFEHPDSSGCNTPDPQEPTPEQSLIAWWSFDNKNIGHDESGNGHDAVAVGNITQTKGIKGAALLNQSYGGGLDVVDDDAFKLTGSFSISTWLRVDKLNSGHSLVFFRGDSRPGVDAYFVTVYPNKMLHFSIQDSANNISTVTCPISLQKFIHCTAIFDAQNQTQQLYINGNLVATTQTALTPINELDQSERPGIGIGHHAYRSTFGDYPFTGALDEMRIYNRALSAQEVSTVYTSDLTR